MAQVCWQILRVCHCQHLRGGAVFCQRGAKDSNITILPGDLFGSFQKSGPHIAHKKEPPPIYRNSQLGTAAFQFPSYYCSTCFNGACCGASSPLIGLLAVSCFCWNPKAKLGCQTLLRMRSLCVLSTSAWRGFGGGLHACIRKKILVTTGSAYFGCLKGGFNVSSGTVQWYRSGYGIDLDNSEIASPVQVASVYC